MTSKMISSEDTKKFVLKSDGTPVGTSLMFNGQPIPNIQKIEYIIEAGSPVRMVVHLIPHQQIEVEGEVDLNNSVMTLAEEPEQASS